jgi:hypothetical protein
LKKTLKAIETELEELSLNGVELKHYIKEFYLKDGDDRLLNLLINWVGIDNVDSSVIQIQSHYIHSLIYKSEGVKYVEVVDKVTKHLDFLKMVIGYFSKVYKLPNLKLFCDTEVPPFISYAIEVNKDMFMMYLTVEK